MRRLLDGLYAASGALAALFLFAIFVVVIVQVGFNVADRVIQMVTGRPVGLLLPSYAEFAGFFLAATTFLALAYTLRAGGLIRVSLLLQHLPPGLRRWLEVWCCTVAAALAGFFTWRAGVLAYDSWRFDDRSYGLVSIPIWIPQAAMVLGLAVLTVALVDELVAVLRGQVPSYVEGEALLSPSDEP